MPPRSEAHAALGRAVRRVREGQGMTQEQLATASGLQATYISDVERGVRNPSWTVVVTLAEGLGTTPARLANEAEAEGSR